MKKYKCDWQGHRVALKTLVEAETAEEALEIFHARVTGPVGMPLDPSRTKVTEIQEEEYERLRYTQEWGVSKRYKNDGDWMGPSV